MEKKFIVTVEVHKQIRVSAENEKLAFIKAENLSKLWPKSIPGTKLMRIKEI